MTFCKFLFQRLQPNHFNHKITKLANNFRQFDSTSEMDKGNPIPTYIKRGLPNLLAAICVALSTTLLVVAWATPNWLQWNTGVTTNSIFDKLGLWVKCNNNRDGNYGQTTYWPGYWETTSSLCVWIIGSSKVSGGWSCRFYKAESFQNFEKLETWNQAFCTCLFVYKLKLWKRLY